MGEEFQIDKLLEGSLCERPAITSVQYKDDVIHAPPLSQSTHHAGWREHEEPTVLVRAESG